MFVRRHFSLTELICLGDSLTFGPGVPKSQKWTSLAHSEHLRINNLGIPGDTTAGMLARLQNLLQTPVLQLNPVLRPMVLILGGTNDIFFAGSDIAARGNLAAMVHQLSAAGYLYSLDFFENSVKLLVFHKTHIDNHIDFISTL